MGEDWVVVRGVAVPPSRAADALFLLRWAEQRGLLRLLPDGRVALRRCLLELMRERLGAVPVEPAGDMEPA